MDRVQGPFEHPILYGCFVGAAFGMTWYVLCARSSMFTRIFKSALTFFGAALAWSSGPLTALVAQVLLIGWDVTTSWYKKRWVLLAILVAIAWVLVDIVSNRSPPEVFISYLAFNEHTASNRIRIFGKSASPQSPASTRPHGWRSSPGRTGCSR